MTTLLKADLWCLTRDRETLVIRRWEYYDDGTKKFVRLPRSEYSHLDSQEKLEQYLKVLNYREDIKAEAELYFQLENAFVEKETVRKFYDSLYKRTRSLKHSKQVFSAFQRYFLQFFHENKLPDFLDWPNKQVELIDWLMDKGLSKRTIEQILLSGSQFFAFLHKETKGRVPELQFTVDSIPEVRWKTYEYDRKKGTKQGFYIKAADWALIHCHAEDDIKATLSLCYGYGLRRAEALALSPSCIKKGHLLISEQLESYDNITGEIKKRPVKFVDSRKVPHFFSKDLEKLYSLILDVRPMHPDTLTSRWNLLLENINKAHGTTLFYRLHDLRNTFCSRLLEAGVTIREAQLALGHKSVRTTEKYLRDHRDLDDEDWKPEVK